MALSYKKAAEGFPSAAVRVLFLDGGADDLHHRIMQVFPLQGKIDLCLQEAFFVTDIIASALKIIGVDRFLSAQAVDRISELDLIAFARCLCLQQIEDGRCQHITAQDGEIARRFFSGWLLHESADLAQALAELFLRIDDAVFVDDLRCDPLYADDAVAGLMVNVHQLLRCGLTVAVDDDVIPQQDRKRLISDKRSCA